MPQGVRHSGLVGVFFKRSGHMIRPNFRFGDKRDEKQNKEPAKREELARK